MQLYSFGKQNCQKCAVLQVTLSIIHSQHFCIFFLDSSEKEITGEHVVCLLTFICSFFTPQSETLWWIHCQGKTKTNKKNTIEKERPDRERKSSVSPLFGNVNIKKCRLESLISACEVKYSHHIGLEKRFGLATIDYNVPQRT